MFVPVDEIEWIQAAENYAELHTIERKPGAGCYLLQATMNTLEASLDPEKFLRIHRSLIVNIGSKNFSRRGMESMWWCCGVVSASNPGGVITRS